MNILVCEPCERYYAQGGPPEIQRFCPYCGRDLRLASQDEILEFIESLKRRRDEPIPE